jgi:hypothetical protein
MAIQKTLKAKKKGMLLFRGLWDERPAWPKNEEILEKNFKNFNR